MSEQNFNQKTITNLRFSVGLDPLTLNPQNEIELLKAENIKLKTEKPAVKIKAEATEYQASDIKNPMRPDVDEAGLVSFFEIEK